MEKLYKVETATRLMTYRQAVNFLYHTQGINERSATNHMEEVTQ